MLVGVGLASCNPQLPEVRTGPQDRRTFPWWTTLGGVLARVPPDRPRRCPKNLNACARSLVMTLLEAGAAPFLQRGTVGASVGAHSTARRITAVAMVGGCAGFHSPPRLCFSQGATRQSISDIITGG